MKSSVTSQQGVHRPHIYELDPLRAVTALVVVAVHVLAFTVVLNKTTTGIQVQNAFVVSVHFTRALFMFVTAFAMTYVYSGKKVPIARFWKKRGIGVLVPYCIWSVIYVFVNQPPTTPLHFASASLTAILTGTSSYQMYYILMTLQFYLLLPVFLYLLEKVKNHPWRALSISFALQLVFFYVDFHFIQAGPFANTHVGKVVNSFQDEFVVIYQFYFLLGGLTALYFQPIKSFLLRYGKLVVCGMILMTVALWIDFFMQINTLREPISLAVSVLQPVMVPYSGMVIVFALWLACKWAGTRDSKGKPRGYGLWDQLSKASFGIYLIHALLLTVILQKITPAMPQDWPVAVRVLLTWIIAAGSAAMLSIVMVNTPLVSRLMGRARPLPAWLTRKQITSKQEQVASKQQAG